MTAVIEMQPDPRGVASLTQPTVATWYVFATGPLTVRPTHVSNAISAISVILQGLSPLEWSLPDSGTPLALVIYNGDAPPQSKRKSR